MDETVGKIVVGVSVVLGVILSQVLQRRRNKRLAASIEPTLRERGPLTLPALAEAMGMPGFYARGKVVLALNDLVSAGSVEVIPAPEGTPQLEKVRHILYKWKT